MPDVPMPRLSDSMDEGTIVAWLVADGSTVAHGDEIVEIETDKATTTYAAPHDGVLRVLVAAGETRDVGTAIAVIGTSRAPGAEIGTTTDPGHEADRSERPPVAAPAADGRGDAHADGSHGGTPTRPGRRRPLATPVARRIAREHEIDLDLVRGSGPHGRVTKSDVLAIAAGSGATPGTPDGGSTVPNVAADVTAGTIDADVVRAPTRIEALIARRMEDSRRDIPEFTVTVDVAMDAVLDARATLREFASESDIVPTVNDFIVLACARALREQPDVRRAWHDGSIVAFAAVNIGVAVAAADGGLLVPVVPDADRRPLRDLAAIARDLTQRARDGRCTPAELSGGVFTVSNLGMFGVAQFTAIVTPGQGAILSVGASTERLVMADGTVATRRYAGLTLNCDHRVIYGAHAAAFLDRVRTLLERPIALLA